MIQIPVKHSSCNIAICKAFLSEDPNVTSVLVENERKRSLKLMHRYVTFGVRTSPKTTMFANCVYVGNESPETDVFRFRQA